MKDIVNYDSNFSKIVHVQEQGKKRQQHYVPAINEEPFQDYRNTIVQHAKSGTYLPENVVQGLEQAQKYERAQQKRDSSFRSSRNNRRSESEIRLKRHPRVARIPEFEQGDGHLGKPQASRKSRRNMRNNSEHVIHQTPIFSQSKIRGEMNDYEK